MKFEEMDRDQLINELIFLQNRFNKLNSSISESGTNKASADPVESSKVISSQNLIDSLPFYVLLVDSDHKIIMANKAVENKLGLSPDKIIGGYCPKLIHGLNHPYKHCPLEESVKCGHNIELEYFEENKNKWFTSAIYASEAKTQSGKTIYFHMLNDITKEKESEQKLLQSLSNFKKLTKAVIEAIEISVDKRDPYTAGHQMRVSKLSEMIARELKLSDDQVEGTRVSALIHDLGKIGVPIEILSKPGVISVHEFNIIKNHSEAGFEILNGIDFPWPVAEIVLQHHERINGSGYPRGLKNDEILVEARIIAVADVVEAMSSHRPYRPARSIDNALEEIITNKGILYDSDVVETCVSIFKNGFTFA